jgi:hypothetical protein
LAQWRRRFAERWWLGTAPTLGRDAAQHAFEWAWAHRSRLDGIDNPAGYLFRVGQSHAKRELRRSRVPANSLWPATVVDGDSPFEPELATALATLSEQQRAAVLLVHGYGSSLCCVARPDRRSVLLVVGPWDASSVPNDIHLLRKTVSTLVQSGFHVAVFGGWGEELYGLSAPRKHHDIDLLVIDADLVTLDAFVQARGVVVAKRQTHKRAFTSEGVLVELFLVSTLEGQMLTNFWSSFVYRWPNLGPGRSRRPSGRLGGRTRGVSGRPSRIAAHRP